MGAAYRNVDAIFGATRAAPVGHRVEHRWRDERRRRRFGANGLREGRYRVMKITVIAPNISENISGEAIKALQYVTHLSDIGADLTIICHTRSRGEFEHGVPTANIHYVDDDLLHQLVWNTVVFRPFLALVFFQKVRRLIKEIAADAPDMIFQYLCPVSPIYLRLPVRGVYNVLGPVTGNIYFPPELSAREPARLRWRRLIHRPTQILSKYLIRDKNKFDRILISGGARTAESLIWSGARREQFEFVLDSGVSKRIFDRPQIDHVGPNYRFLCNGRLASHKGVELAIRAVQRANKNITLDIYGKGPMQAPLQRLIDALDLGDRVVMRGWMAPHDALLDKMQEYRGFVFPSMAEANGIVVQEALCMGLPVICLDWGGPALLTTDETAIRIAPTDEDEIINALARGMNQLAEDPDLARRIAAAGVRHARENFSWSAVAAQWADHFH